VGYALYLADRLGVSADFEPRTRDYLARLTARPAFPARRRTAKRHGAGGVRVCLEMRLRRIAAPA